MTNGLLIHIPHSSRFIPRKYLKLFFLNKENLYKEQLKMTDSWTNELFKIKNAKRLVFTVNRLVCDVERFRNEKDEEMSKQGMWICYTKTSDLKPLKSVSETHKREILTKYYDKHHLNFGNSVKNILKEFGKCLIIDAHSFSSKLLPYELYSAGFRPDICIGTDDFHTPSHLIDYFCKTFTEKGYITGINSPFKGTVVPLEFYNKDKNVKSIMLEINRSLYMDEKTGGKNSNFLKVKKDITEIIENIPQIF